MKGKTPRESMTEMTELVLPNDTNLLGNLLGGRLMHWIDIAAATAASRHSNKTVATVEVDSIDFKHPVKMGELVILKACLVHVGRTSMRVNVKVYAENVLNDEVVLTNSASLTFVALDENGRPTPVPPLILETDEERALFEREEKRRQKRLSSKGKG